MTEIGRVLDFMAERATDELCCTPLLSAIGAQAAAADLSRSVDPAVITAIRNSDLIRLSATSELGGLGASMSHIARELEAVAAACGSTAWCLWNHLCVFHLFCGCLGPGHHDLLKGVVARREWVVFPGGAGTRMIGRRDGDEFVLNGPAAFGSGGRYGDWLGVAFAVDGGDGRPASPADLRFTIVSTDAPGVEIDPTWDGMSLRASATDTVHYRDVVVPGNRCAPWFGVNRADLLRDPDLPMINPRYREDWVGLSVLWLGSMAVGVAQASLEEACDGIQGRKAILGARLTERSTVHVNIGRAAALIAAARAAIEAGCGHVDERIDQGQIPDETDYLRQMAHGTMALGQCDEAMKLILRVLGGNGLREGTAFERRYRDFQAMPLHINGHEDRVTEQLGRHLLGLETAAF